jgi:hypothetical protein
VETAAVLISQRYYQEASPILEDALEIRETLFGHDSKQVALVLTDMGNLQKMKCKFGIVVR